MDKVIISIDYGEFRERLRGLLDKEKFHEGNPSRLWWSFDCGATTMFYEACGLLIQMDSERMEKEMDERRASRDRLAVAGNVGK